MLMSLLFEGMLTNKEAAFKEHLTHCSSVIELDFLRTVGLNKDVINWDSPENTINVHALGYSIKELPKESHTYKLYRYPSLLFFDYPKYENVDNNVNFRYTHSENFFRPIHKYIPHYQQIPTILRLDDMIEITDNHSVEKATTIIQLNLKKIYKTIEVSAYAVYVSTYIDMLTILTKEQFSPAELQFIDTQLQKTITLQMRIDSHLHENNLVQSKEELSTLQQKYKSDIDALNRIESIDVEIQGTAHDNGGKDIQSKIEYTIGLIKEHSPADCEIYTIDESIRVKPKSPLQLLNLYSSLSTLTNLKVTLNITAMSESISSENTMLHTIQITSTPWAFVYHKLYGDNIAYTEDKDKEVHDILTYINKTKLPVEYILRRVI